MAKCKVNYRVGDCRPEVAVTAQLLQLSGCDDLMSLSVGSIDHYSSSSSATLSYFYYKCNHKKTVYPQLNSKGALTARVKVGEITLRLTSSTYVCIYVNRLPPYGVPVAVTGCMLVTASRLVAVIANSSRDVEPVSGRLTELTKPRCNSLTHRIISNEVIGKS